MSTESKAKKQDQEVEQSLYAKREKIYAREVHGMFAALRLTGVGVLLGLYYLAAWLQWDGRQAILFDLPERKFYIFGMVFWPQDFVYLTALLLVSAVALFFFTALAGRLWCGYACPQTVWTEIFMWFEHKIEGDRPKAMKLDKGPWNAKKIRIKTTKHLVWAVFALWTGFTFVGYFTPIRELWANTLTWSLGPWETFWMFFYGFATWGNAGFMREQVCIYMCPYARFQSAMFDKDTLIISYDDKRGEPRGSRRKSANPQEMGLGDCIDCTMCVQVCPTGIDIRDGLQYQCIGCAACIDACDEVMDKMGYDKGLVRYTTENVINGGTSHIFRPRVLIYAAILMLVTVLTAISILSRDVIALDVIRDRNSLYRETMDGLIENVYILKAINMDQQGHTFKVTASGPDGLILKIDKPSVEIPSGEVREISVRLQLDPESMTSRSEDVEFHLEALDAPELVTTEEARLVGPVPGL